VSVYRTSEFEADVGFEATLVDTNVIVAGFLEEDQNHTDARYYLDELVEQIIIPSAVLVESWGMLVGSRKRMDLGLRMLSWIQDPGNNVILVPSHGDNFDNMCHIVGQLRVDCVDSILIALASEISVKCRSGRSVRIATFDTRDFLRASRTKLGTFDLLDLTTLEELRFGLG
jgi:predicted nucleic acid-binding protein